MNFGVIITQRYLTEYEWKGLKYFSYLISFNEYEGLFIINRSQKYEQALIGAKVLFNVDKFDIAKIQNYKILGYQIKEEHLTKHKNGTGISKR